MQLPIEGLDNLYYLEAKCLGHCKTIESAETLTTIGKNVYPYFVAQLVEVSQSLFSVLQETEGLTPYLAGAGPNFIKQLSQIKEIGIDCLSNKLPLRFHNSTQKNSFCQYLDDARE